MARTLISTGSSFEQAGAYSRAVVDGDFCFVAGTTGYDYATMQMPGDIGEQTRNCFQTIEDVLSRAGFRLSDVVRAVYYVVAMTEAERVLEICAEHFRDIRPAGTIVEVRRLLKPEMRIEIEVTAKRSTP